MHILTVPISEIRNRLDASYYEPEAASLLRKILDQGFTLSTVDELSSRMNSGPFGSSLHAKDYVQQEKGVIFFRPVDCKSLVANDNNGNVYISRIDNQRLKSSSFTSGSIIVTKIGNGIGDLSVVPKSTPVCNISGNMMGFDLSDQDPYFVSAYFHSRHGAAQIRRSIIGGPMPKMDMETVGELQIPVFNTSTQTFIGDKVRQAEQLRVLTRELEGEAGEFFANRTHVRDIPGSRKSYRVRRVNFSPVRLDAPFYDPAQLQLEESLLASGGKVLSDKGKPIRNQRKKTTKIRYFEIGGLDISTGIITPTLLPGAQAPSRAQISIQPWDVLVSTVRPNRKNVGLVLPQESDEQLVASTGFSILQFASPEEAVFYHGWLRANEATFQMLRWNSGGTYPAIDHEVPGGILVPEFSSDVVKSCGNKWKLKFLGLELSERLTTAAKLIVESLIEGQFSESDLIATQKALEAGDRKSDREILSRLTRKGIDAPGEPPLFPDLDALYNAVGALGNQEEAQ